MQTGDRVEWISPMGLIWLGTVEVVREDGWVSIFWDGKWGAGPFQDPTPYRVYAKAGAQK